MERWHNDQALEGISGKNRVFGTSSNHTICSHRRDRFCGSTDGPVLELRPEICCWTHLTLHLSKYMQTQTISRPASSTMERERHGGRAPCIRALFLFWPVSQQSTLFGDISVKDQLSRNHIVHGFGSLSFLAVILVSSWGTPTFSPARALPAASCQIFPTMKSSEDSEDSTDLPPPWNSSTISLSFSLF